MSLTKAALRLSLCLVTTQSCQVEKKFSRPEFTDCQQKLGFWESEFAKIPPGPPRQRIKAIESIAGRIGEDPEQCTADKIRRAADAETIRLISLIVAGKKISPAAVYTCRRLSEELKCNSSVADGTAHLSESLVPEIAIGPGQRFTLDLDASLSRRDMHVYSAADSTLMDAPKYVELRPDTTETFILPDLSGRAVLFAVLKDKSSGLYNKFVWLVKS